MKMKKLLSTFAAMAIAASSFAGLGISANAANGDFVTMKYNSSATYDTTGIKEVVFGNVDSANNKISAETFTDYEEGKPFYSNIATFSSDQKFNNGKSADDSSVAMSGSYISQTGTELSAGFENTVTNGIVKLSVVTNTTAGQWKPFFRLTNGDNETVLLSMNEYKASNAGSKDLITIDGTAVEKTFYNNRHNVATEITIDLDKLTSEYLVECAYNAGAYGYGRFNSYTGTQAISDGYNVKNIVLQARGSMDNILFYSYMPANRKAVTFTVKDKENNNVQDAVISVEGYRTAKTDSNGQAVMYLDSSETAYTYSIDAGSAYISATGTVTVSDTTSQNVTLEQQTATPCTLTLKYVDANGTELKNESAANDAFVNVEYELTETEKADFTYTNESGVEYTAKVSTASVTPTTATATCNVTCTLVEKKYDATVTSLPHSKVTISGTSTSGESVNDVVYTDKTGTATVNTYVGTYTVSVKKTNYTTQTSSLTVNNAGTGTVAVSIAPTTDGVVYYEDFNNTGYSDGSLGVLIGGMRVAKGVAYTYNTSNSTNSYQLPASSYNSYSINISGLYAQAKDASRTTYISFKNNDVDVFKVTTVGQGTVSETAQRNISVSADDTSVVLETSATGDVSITGDLSVTINADGTITGTWGEKTFELSIDKANVGITSMEVAISGNAKVYMSLEDFKITGKTAPVIESVATSSTDVSVAVPTDDQAITAVTSGVDNTTYGAIKGDKTLTTVYIKVANPTDGVAPKLTVGGQDYQATYSGVKDYNGYYVYQILSDNAIDLSNYKVTYTGAADKTVSSEA